MKIRANLNLKALLLLPNKTYCVSRWQQNNNPILKNYFNTRMELSNVDLVKILENLYEERPRYQINKDHRFVHLITKIQGNINKFGITQKLKIAKALSKLNYKESLFKSIIDSLTNSLDHLLLDEISTFLNLMTLGSQIDVDKIGNICNKLVKKLDNSEAVLVTFSHSSNIHFESQSGVSGNNQAIQFKSLLIILWSLHRLKIKDNLLLGIIMRKYIKPNVKHIPVNLIPFTISILELYEMKNKRVFQQVINNLKQQKNQVVIEQLDIQKLKTLIVKIAGAKQQDRFVLWLLETLIIRVKNDKASKKILSEVDCYKMYRSLAKNKIYDGQLLKFLVNRIIQDLQCLQGYQVIRLVSGLVRTAPKDFESEIKTISEYIWGKFHFFISKYHENNPARIELRRLVVKKKLIAPKGITKLLGKEEKQVEANNRNKEKKHKKSREETKNRNKDLDKQKQNKQDETSNKE